MFVLVILLTLFAPATASAGVPAAASPAAVAAAIATLLRASDVPAIGHVSLDGPALRALYQSRAGAPLWTGDRAAAALAAVRAAADDGLEPGAYHADAIARRAAAHDARSEAELDVLVSDGLLHLAADLRGGRRPPRRHTPEIDLQPKLVDAVRLVRDAHDATDLPAYMHALAPRNADYQALRDALAGYRALVAAGGWPTLPEGPSLEPGVTDPAVPVLRHRLAITGDLAAEHVDGDQYDGDVQAAVQHFQRRHGITPDGVVGRTTRVALNVSAQNRVTQLALNMERWRWLADDLGRRHVRVNIAGFWLGLVEDGRPVHEMPVVVGRDEWETPVFSSRITHVVFNPRWTVPAAIAQEDLLPKLRKEPDYLAKHGIRVYASWAHDAEPVDPTSLDWNAIGDDVTRLRFVQDPGPENPLGRIKFELPNVFDVYLHDTPSQPLFQRPIRMYSHGCVRVGDADALAAWLFGDMPEWNAQRRAEILASFETKTVRLRTPVAVHVLYLTAWADADGVHFRRDFYGRDEPLRLAMHRRDDGRTPAALAASDGHGTP